MVDPNGFDHDDGMNAFTVEKNAVLRKRGTYVGGAPAYVMAQVHKEKDMFNIVVSASVQCMFTMACSCTVCHVSGSSEGTCVPAWPDLHDARSQTMLGVSVCCELSQLKTACTVVSCLHVKLTTAYI